jgi:hypothetical protein
MDEEYEIIRQALIDLLCIGSKINFVHRFNGYNSIRESFVTRFISKGVIIHNHIRVSESCFFNCMEQYEGQLYIWEDPQIPRHLKIKRIIEIVNDDDTIFE